MDMLKTTDLPGDAYVVTDFTGTRGKAFTVYGTDGSYVRHEVLESMTHAEIAEMVRADLDGWLPDAPSL
jgi:hypothetical protein